MKKVLLVLSLVLFLFSLQAFACGENCALKGKEILKYEEGTLKGTIICQHCKLNQGDKCAPVLQTEDGKIFQLCPDSIKDKKIDPHSNLKVEVTGKIGYPKEGNPVIHIKELKEIK